MGERIEEKKALLIKSGWIFNENLEYNKYDLPAVSWSEKTHSITYEVDCKTVFGQLIMCKKD